MARSLAGLPSLPDTSFDGHIYTSGRMGSNQSKTRFLPKTIAPRGTKRTRGIPGLQFRVLVIGRANAGKTSILQRVCDTTESPKIYREGEEVRSTNLV
jgi:GTP-binding protein EngB required for normal cell division